MFTIAAKCRGQRLYYEWKRAGCAPGAVRSAALPTRDLFHEAVRQALERDGWTITPDPYALAFGQHNLYVDLGAERILAAEKAGEQIAVEIKTFSGKSEIRDLETAVGQYVVYRTLLSRQD